VLRDEQKRKQYDSFGHDAYQQAASGGGGGPGPHGGFENINLEELLREFGFGGGGRRGGGGFSWGGFEQAKPQTKGQDYEV
jgi:DnaJ-class molecular chaperone